VSENCAAIPEALFESTLFGHEAGAFTGAIEARPGLFELASGGTMFLDEIGELSAACQAKLLRVLQEHTVRRVGGRDEIAVDARVISATNVDLEARVRKGTFREDLYYRLNAVVVRVPALRERREDIPSLVAKMFERAGVAPIPFTAEPLRAFANHAWPGNVRELENEVRRLASLGLERVVLQDLSPHLVQGGPGPARSSEVELPTLKENERRLIVATLRAARGNQSKAAALLGIPRTSLWRKLKHHSITEEEFTS
jgi:transcriptional regulator with PAS, ATPase and Fis domain